MNTPNEPNPIQSSESITAKNPNPGVNNSEPQFTIPGPLPETKPATQETLHLSTHKPELIGPVNQVAAIDPVIAPPLAAKGDDDVMSQPQKQS